MTRALPLFQVVMEKAFNVTLSQSSQATSGWTVFTLATSTLVYGPIMQKIGRRPIFLWGTLCMVAGSFGAWKSSSVSVAFLANILGDRGNETFATVRGHVGFPSCSRPWNGEPRWNYLEILSISN
jgi:MFS family permease